MGNPVDEKGEADAVEDVIEENLCGWVLVFGDKFDIFKNHCHMEHACLL